MSVKARLIEMGARLRECRARVRLTPDEVAAELKVSPKTVYAWENGSREPSAMTLGNLALIYGVASDYILFGTHMVPEDLRNVFQRAGTSPSPK